MRWKGAVVAGLAVVSSCFLQPATSIHGAEEPGEFKTVTIDDLFGGPPESLGVDKYLDINVDVPAIYSDHPSPEWAGERIWSTDADMEKIAKAWEEEKALPPHERGFFSIKVSMNFGYDAQRDVFSDFQGTDEKNLKKAMSDAGLQVTDIQRRDIKGFPVLIVEAEAGENKSRTAYIATKVDTNVLFIYYGHTHPWSAWDDKVWGRFKSTLLASSAQ